MTATEQMRVPTRNGTVDLVADVAGNPTDQAVLLFHGGGQTRHAWGGALQALAGSGWYGASFDLPGHGDSGWAPDGRYDLELFAGCVADAAAEFDRPALVGASLGGISSLVAVGEGLRRTRPRWCWSMSHRRWRPRASNASAIS